MSNQESSRALLQAHIAACTEPWLPRDASIERIHWYSHTDAAIERFEGEQGDIEALLGAIYAQPVPASVGTDPFISAHLRSGLESRRTPVASVLFAVREEDRHAPAIVTYDPGEVPSTRIVQSKPHHHVSRAQRRVTLPLVRQQARAPR